MNKKEKIMALREASKVERCHTILHHGSYTNGQHSYDVANLILTLHPSPSLNLIKVALWHDCAERWSGDVPSPVKSHEPDLAEALSRVEARVEDELGVRVALTEEERRWLHAADRVELWLWAVEQVEMGNKYAMEVRDVLEDELWHHADWLPIECKTFVQDYQWKPCSDLTAQWRRG